MKNGELIKFRNGLFGLKKPYNIGVYLGYSKKNKKNAIFTIDGKKMLNKGDIVKGPKNIVVFTSEEMGDSFKMKEKLKMMASGKNGKKDNKKQYPQHSKNHVIEDKDIIGKKITPRAIWLEVKDEKEPMAIGDIASKFFGVDSCSHGRTQMIRSTITESIEKLLPYFKQSGKKGYYSILSQKQFQWINETISNLHSIFRTLHEEKKRVLNEKWPGKGEKAPSASELSVIFEELSRNLNDPKIYEKGTPILDQSRKELFIKLCRYMEEFIVRDKWPGRKKREKMGLEGIRSENFVMEEFIVELAGSITELRRSSFTTIFSVFLLVTGYWNMKKALNRFIERLYRTGLFDFDSGYPKNSYDTHLLQEYHNTRAQDNFTDSTKTVGHGHKSIRKDMRHLLTYTIDPRDAKDFDDAISIVKRNGHIVLFVHIADVSHYVKQNSTLDIEAQKRCTSVYLPGTVLPMLPEILSNDMCSLKEKVERKAITTKMTFDKNCVITGFDVFSSTIKVNNNLCYQDVLDYYDCKKEPFWSWVNFAEKLRERRHELQIETGEIRLNVNENTLEKEIKYANRATRMIETFMVKTNELIAMYLWAHTHKNIFRVHDGPDIVKLEQFNSISKRKGMKDVEINPKFLESKKNEVEDDNRLTIGNIRIKTDKNIDKKLLRTLSMFGEAGKNEKKEEEQQTRKKMRKYFNNNRLDRVLELVEKKMAETIDLEKRDYLIESLNTVLKGINRELTEPDLKDIMNLAILKTLHMALYSTENIGHFGLGSNCYLHFTSPIRRYADLIVHRILKNIFQAREEQGSSNKWPDNDVLVDYSEKQLLELAEKCSERSREAEKYEYSVKDIILCLDCILDDNFMKNKHVGIVSGMIPRGIFVKIRERIEGFIPKSGISKKKIHINEEGTEMICIDKKWDKNRKEKNEEKEETIIGIGDKVIVRPGKYIVEKGNMDLNLIKITGK